MVDLSSGCVKIVIENGPVEIGRVPMKNGDFPQLRERLPEGN